MKLSVNGCERLVDCIHTADKHGPNTTFWHIRDPYLMYVNKTNTNCVTSASFNGSNSVATPQTPAGHTESHTSVPGTTFFHS